MKNEVTLKFNTKEVMHSIQQAASERMIEAVNEVRNVTLETLSGHRSGRIYYVPGTRRRYTASAPGEAPAQATGKLRQSVKTTIEGKDRAVIGKVGTDLEYGKVLEFGTRGPKLAPRPWLRPSFEKALPRVKEILSRKWL